MTREGFIEYVDKYVNFISLEKCSNGTVFMNVLGYDGGDLKKNGLEAGPKYNNPADIDDFLQSTFDTFHDLIQDSDIELPKVSYVQFCQKFV